MNVAKPVTRLLRILLGLHRSLQAETDRWLDVVDQPVSEAETFSVRRILLRLLVAGALGMYHGLTFPVYLVRALMSKSFIRREATRTQSPPGLLLDSFAEFFFSPRKYERVLRPVIDEMRRECDVLRADQRFAKARWARIRWTVAFWHAAGFQKVVSIIVRITATIRAAL